MSKAEYKKILGEMEEAWKERREEGFEDGFAQHPAGTFVQKLTGAKMGKLDSGVAYFVINYVTLEGKSKGKRFGDFQRITADRLGFIGLCFTRLGIEPPEFMKDIPDLIDQLSDSGLIVKQKISHNAYTDANGNEQVGVNGMVLSVLEGLDESEAEEAEEVAEPEAAESAEEIEVDIKELRRVLGEYDIKPPKGLKTVSDIAEWINKEEYELSTENVEEDEDNTLSLFLAAGINVEGAEGAEDADTVENDSSDIDALRIVCTNNKINFEEDDTAEQLAERLLGFDWSVSEDGLEKNEVAAMKKYGLEVAK